MRRKHDNIEKPKPELQDVIGEILSNYRIDMFGHYKYDFKLKMPAHLIIKNTDSFASVRHCYEPDGDLVLFVKKIDRFMRIGLYYEQKGDDFSDPVIAIDCFNMEWRPIRIERASRNTVISHTEGCGRVMYSDKIDEFLSFQRMFALYIKEQGWLKNGVRIRRE